MVNTNSTKIQNITDFQSVGTLSCEHCIYFANAPSDFHCQDCARMHPDFFKPSTDTFANVDVDQMVSNISAEQKEYAINQIVALLVKLSESE